MNFADIKKLDSQETVDLFNTAVSEISIVLDRQFLRPETDSYKCFKNGHRYCLPKPLCLSDVRGSFSDENRGRKRVYYPIMFFSPPIIKGDSERHAVKIEYCPQFLYGVYMKKLPEINVELYGSEVEMTHVVLDKMKELNLKPKAKPQALASREFIHASLLPSI